MILLVGIYGVLAWWWLTGIMDLFQPICQSFVDAFTKDPDYYRAAPDRFISEMMHTPPFEWTYTAFAYLAHYITKITDDHLAGVTWIVCISYLVFDFLHAIITRRPLKW
jgi:hypothetical protein